MIAVRRAVHEEEMLELLMERSRREFLMPYP